MARKTTTSCGRVASPSWVSRLPVIALDLQLAVLDVELLDELLKHVARFTHQLLCLLFGHLLTQVNVGALEVREKQYEDPEGIARYLNKVNSAIDVVEVSVEHLALRVDVVLLVILQWHGRRPLLRHYVDLVLGGHGSQLLGNRLAIETDAVGCRILRNAE